MVGISEPLAGHTAMGGRNVLRTSAGWTGKKRELDTPHSSMHGALREYTVLRKTYLFIIEMRTLAAQPDLKLVA